MSKKVFIQPKKTRDHKDLDDWVGGGGESSEATLPPKPQADSQSVQEKPVVEESAPKEQKSTPRGFPAQDMKRLTIDVPKDLHRRIKQTCAAKDLKIAEEVRRILDREFPPLV